MTPNMMDTNSPDDGDYAMLRDTARDWITAHAPVRSLRDVRAHADLHHDGPLWREMIRMGWIGTAIRGEDGGVGFGTRGIGILMEEIGRTLVPVPLLAAALGATALLAIGATPSARSRWLPQLLSGERLVIPAIDAGGHGEAALPTARRTANGWSLNGRVGVVMDGMAADLFLIPARSDQAPQDILIFAVDAGRTDRTPIGLIDSRDYARLQLIDLSTSEDALLGSASASMLETVFDHVRIGLAAEMIGTAQAAFDMTIAYLKTRVQFERPIGTFQALQHRAAQMLISLELTRAAIDAALAGADDAAPDLPAMASRAKALAGETLHLVSSEAIQMHGGIGMTDEHDIGLYLKRARVAEALFGSAHVHRERFATARGF